jgi:hypothetical protein
VAREVGRAKVDPPAKAPRAAPFHPGFDRRPRFLPEARKIARHPVRPLRRRTRNAHLAVAKKGDGKVFIVS